MEHHTERNVTQKQLSEAFNVKHSTMAGILQRMVEKDLLEIRPNPDNKKFKNILKYCRGKKIQIRGKNDKEIVGCLDGETRIKKEFNVEIISNAINFILPDVEINKYQ